MVPQEESKVSPEEARRELSPEKLYAVFGGGVGAFGRNFTVFTTQGKTLWIDTGCGFPSGEYPGLSKTLPSFELLEAFPPDVVVLTHGHEDHIGAIPAIVDFIPPQTPVFASPFTIALVKKKLREGDLGEDALNIKKVEENGVFYSESFQLSAFFVPHSIPQTFGVGIELPAGGGGEIPKKLFYTSDFKLKGDEKNFTSEAIEGFGPVDYMFSDSTGALSGGSAPSEEEVRKNLEKVISAWEGRVIVTTFSSQISRIKSVYEIAEKLRRPLGIRGHSIRVHMQAAFDSGEFPTPAWKIASPSPEHPKAIWLVAGCQAEEGSSFDRFSKSALGKLTPDKRDLVLYSGSVIPGNTEQVLGALNLLAKQGISIYGMAGEEEAIHASGHARRDELETMVRWLRPRVVCPVHGDPLHFQGFSSFLKNIPESSLETLSDEWVYELGKKPSPIAQLDCDPVFIDAGEIHSEKKIYCYRRNLASSGICNIVVEAQSGAIRELQYIGVCGEGLLGERIGQLRDEIQRVLARGNESETPRENKVKQKIAKINLKHLNKTPFVNLIQMP